MNVKSCFIIGVIFAITLSQFLAIDDTDTHVYVKGEYECKDFSRDLILNAYHYRLYLDYIYIPEKNHMIVGLYDPKSNLITLIEPQNDNVLGYIKPDNPNYVRIPVWRNTQYYANIGRVM